jgi:hypothetical protein
LASGYLSLNPATQTNIIKIAHPKSPRPQEAARYHFTVQWFFTQGK